MVDSACDRIQYAIGPHPLDGQPSDAPPAGFLPAGPWTALPDGCLGENLTYRVEDGDEVDVLAGWPWCRALSEDYEAARERKEAEKREVAKKIQEEEYAKKAARKEKERIEDEQDARVAWKTIFPGVHPESPKAGPPNWPMKHMGDAAFVCVSVSKDHGGMYCVEFGYSAEKKDYGCTIYRGTPSTARVAFRKALVAYIERNSKGGREYGDMLRKEDMPSIPWAKMALELVGVD